jgi:hypothetical protein
MKSQEGVWSIVLAGGEEHGVRPFVQRWLGRPRPKQYCNSVQRAIWTAEQFPDRLVLLGIVPDRLELDYGWIEPGEELYRASNYRIQAVRTFLPKPTVAEADAALVAGALWDTLVMAAKVETLWNLGWHCVPDLMRHFERLGEAIGTSYETRTIEAIYGQTPCHDFVSELLRHVPDCTAVVEMNRVLWSDWGKPERIANVLRQIGRQPAFPLTCLNRPFAPLSSASPRVVSSQTAERGDTDYADKKTTRFSFQSCRAGARRRRAPQESA